MTNALELNKYDLVEMDSTEMSEIDGGIIPLVAIGIAWGVMAVCSAVALGMKQALDEKN